MGGVATHRGKTEGTPTDNNMKYCCYCGKLLKQEE